MRLLTVFEPAMKAPSAPVTPAKNGHTVPTLPAGLGLGVESMETTYTHSVIGAAGATPGARQARALRSAAVTSSV
jgi:hypothetical protein